MKQVLQNLKSGKIEVADVPCPKVKSGHFLIQSKSSLISTGTERMLVEFGKAGYLEKARKQPDKVWQVLDKIWTDGLLPTVDAVRLKLDQLPGQGYTVQRGTSILCDLMDGASITKDGTLCRTYEHGEH